MGKNGATKKEINRMKKADLIKLITAKGLPCNKKMSKVNLVACVFKHKELRRDFVVPPKRKMSEKQMANLNKFKLGGKHQKDFKNEKVIKPKAQYLAELSKLEDKHAPAGRSESHISEVKKDLKVVANKEKVSKREHLDSNRKLDDNVKQHIEARLEKQTDLRLKSSEAEARNTEDVRFGEGGEQQVDISQFLDSNNKLDPNKIARAKKDLEANDPTNPLLQVIYMLEKIAARDRDNRENGREPELPSRSDLVIVDDEQLAIDGGRTEEPIQQQQRENMGTNQEVINSMTLEQAETLLAYMEADGNVPFEIASNEREYAEVMRLLRIRIRRGDGPEQIRAPRENARPQPIVERQPIEQRPATNQEAIMIRSRI